MGTRQKENTLQDSETIEKPAKKLTARQINRTRAFARNLPKNGFNATQAMVEADPTLAYDSAKTQANRTLTNVYTNQVVTEELEQICSPVEAKKQLDRLMKHAKNENVQHNAVVTVLKLHGELIERTENRNINTDVDLDKQAEDAIEALLSQNPVKTETA